MVFGDVYGAGFGQDAGSLRTLGTARLVLPGTTTCTSMAGRVSDDDVVRVQNETSRTDVRKQARVWRSTRSRAMSEYVPREYLIRTLTDAVRDDELPARVEITPKRGNALLKLGQDAGGGQMVLFPREGTIGSLHTWTVGDLERSPLPLEATNGTRPPLPQLRVAGLHGPPISPRSAESAQLVVARTSEGLSFFRGAASSLAFVQTVPVKNVHDVAVNPLSPNEAVATPQDASATLFSCHPSGKFILEGSLPESRASPSNLDRPTSVTFGIHPRSVFVYNRAGIDLWDLRTTRRTPLLRTVDMWPGLGQQDAGILHCRRVPSLGVWAVLVSTTFEASIRDIRNLRYPLSSSPLYLQSDGPGLLDVWEPEHRNGAVAVYAPRDTGTVTLLPWTRLGGCTDGVVGSLCEGQERIVGGCPRGGVSTFSMRGGSVALTGLALTPGTASESFGVTQLASTGALMHQRWRWCADSSDGDSQSESEGSSGRGRAAENHFCGWTVPDISMKYREGLERYLQSKRDTPVADGPVEGVEVLNMTASEHRSAGESSERSARLLYLDAWQDLRVEGMDARLVWESKKELPAAEVDPDAVRTFDSDWRVGER